MPIKPSGRSLSDSVLMIGCMDSHETWKPYFDEDPGDVCDVCGVGIDRWIVIQTAIFHSP